MALTTLFSYKRQVQHPNVVQFKGICVAPTAIMFWVKCQVLGLSFPDTPLRVRKTKARKTKTRKAKTRKTKTVRPI